MTKGKGKLPGAGGLGKHIKSAVHRERAQPSNRKSLGPLEKRKDYKIRAQKRKVRVKRVQQLKRAAAMRNEDEFNVKMTKYKTDVTTGKMKKNEDAATNLNSHAALEKAIKSGNVDAQFLDRKAAEDIQRAKQLSSGIGGLDLGIGASSSSSNKKNKNQQQQPQSHTVFVDSDKEVTGFRAEKHFNTTKQMLQAPAIRGSLSQMGKTRVAHALDHVNDASLIRRFQKGDFDWDEELSALRNGGGDNNNDDDDALVTTKKKNPPLQDTRSLRDSLFANNNNNASASAAGGGEEGENSNNNNKPTVTPAVLLRMLRRAAVLEAQHQEKISHGLAVRTAREVTERVSRAQRLQKLAGVVRKKTQGQSNKLNQKKMNKFRPGVNLRQR